MSQLLPNGTHSLIPNQPTAFFDDVKNDKVLIRRNQSESQFSLIEVTTVIINKSHYHQTKENVKMDLYIREPPINKVYN